MIGYKDRRSKLTSEVVQGINIIKMNVWQGSFIQRICEVRKRELNLIRKVMLLDASWSFSINCIPFMVSLATFATYIYLFNGNLTAEKAFVSIAFFNIMRYPFSTVPHFFNCVVNYRNAAERLSSFLVSEELDMGGITRDFPSNTDTINGKSLKDIPASVEINDGKMKNSLFNAAIYFILYSFFNITSDITNFFIVIFYQGSFSWNKEELRIPTLHGINFEAERGSLVAVVGQVGTGKTSLLSAILGDIQNLTGVVVTPGHIAYVAQEACIQNQSLRDNILFNKGYSDEK